MRSQAVAFIRAPFSLLLFFLLPLAFILQRAFGGSSLPPTALMLNNLLFLIFLLCRLYLDLRRLRSGIRYGARALYRGRGQTFPGDQKELCRRLVQRGYTFDATGRYGERSDRGYWGRIILAAGLAFTLMIGTYDNLRQFSGTFLLGVGGPVLLHKTSSYGDVTTAPLASLESLPAKLQITRQVLPDVRFPKGFTEIALLDQNDRVLQEARISPGEPLRVGEFDLYMGRFVFDAWLVVTTTENHIIFTNFIKLLPAPGPQNSFPFYAKIEDDHFEQVTGEAWLRPQDKTLKVNLDYKGSRIVDVELALWGENQRILDGYIARFEGLGQWSEIHIVRHRHTSALFTGALFAGLGLLIRLIWRPGRVWIDERSHDSFLRTTDSKLIKALKEPHV